MAGFSPSSLTHALAILLAKSSLVVNPSLYIFCNPEVSKNQLMSLFLPVANKVLLTVLQDVAQSL